MVALHGGGPSPRRDPLPRRLRYLQVGVDCSRHSLVIILEFILRTLQAALLDCGETDPLRGKEEGKSKRVGSFVRN